MAGTSAQPPEWLRSDARRVYGVDPEGYDAGRPEYPEQVYEVLRHRCSVGPGTNVVEIGPGTGQVTRRLVTLGATVTGIEPDPAFARYLTREMTGRPVKVIVGSFEDVVLADDMFDAAVAAMSFHWVNQEVGLPKLGRIVRPGGSVALWWTVFGDPDRPDPFLDATRDLLRTGDGVGVGPPDGHWQFELDVAARVSDLADRAGLRDVESELIRWTITLDPLAVRRLYASTIAVRRRPPDEQRRLLDAIVTIAAERFEGVVERPFVTALYTGRGQ